MMFIRLYIYKDELSVCTAVAMTDIDTEIRVLLHHLSSVLIGRIIKYSLTIILSYPIKYYNRGTTTAFVIVSTKNPRPRKRTIGNIMVVIMIGISIIMIGVSLVVTLRVLARKPAKTLRPMNLPIVVNLECLRSVFHMVDVERGREVTFAHSANNALCTDRDHNPYQFGELHGVRTYNDCATACVSASNQEGTLHELRGVDYDCVALTSVTVFTMLLINL